MDNLERPLRISRPLLWLSRIVAGLAVIFFLFDAIGHIVRPVFVVEAFARLSFPIALAPTLGVLQLVLMALYVTPRTRVLSTVLITGYLGGAIAANLRAGDPLSETLFPLIPGILFWVPVYLTIPNVRAVFPLREDAGRQP